MIPVYQITRPSHEDLAHAFRTDLEYTFGPYKYTNVPWFHWGTNQISQFVGETFNPMPMGEEDERQICIDWASTFAHREAHREIVEADHDWALVAEHDVRLVDAGRLDRVLGQLDRLPITSCLVQLHDSPRRAEHFEPLSLGPHLEGEPPMRWVTSRAGTPGAGLYLINRRTAREWAEHQLPIKSIRLDYTMRRPDVLEWSRPIFIRPEFEDGQAGFPGIVQQDPTER